MGKVWKGLPNRRLFEIGRQQMKSRKCTKCNNNTFAEDRVCALCRNSITRMHEELLELLAEWEEMSMVRKRMRTPGLSLAKKRKYHIN